MNDIETGEAYGGPLDGQILEAKYRGVLAVSIKGEGYSIRNTKTVHVKELYGGPHLPKSFRDNPTCIGYYQLIHDRNHLHRKSGTEIYFEWRRNVWTTIKNRNKSFLDQLRNASDARQQLKDNDKKNQKPGWMISSEELDVDYYGENDPADDWKK